LQGAYLSIYPKVAFGWGDAFGVLKPYNKHPDGGYNKKPPLARGLFVESRSL